jgi:hypothetical protein
VVLLVGALVASAIGGTGLTILAAQRGIVGGSAAALAPRAGCASDGVGPCASSAALAPVPYSHSWYIDHPDHVAALGADDARWLNVQATGSECSRAFLTVLDFGHPTRKYMGHASPLDDYAVTLFGHMDTWRTYREVEGIAQTYLDAWAGAASGCVHLHLALGTSNYAECGKAVGPCDVATAGHYWDVVAHDVMASAMAKGYGQMVDVWVGDDLEGSWDPWQTTATFLGAARDQERTYTTHVPLVDFGDADAGACSEVTGDCAAPWTPANVYAAAWGLGWNVPLPEAYTPSTTRLWEEVAATQGPRVTAGALDARDGRGALGFAGVMTECAGADPLTTTPCHPGTDGGTGSSACEWSPAIAFDHLQDVVGPQYRLAYATNIQWPDPPASDQATSSLCG